MKYYPYILKLFKRMIITVIIFFLVVLSFPFLLGWGNHIVFSNSMEPLISSGSIVVVYPISSSHIEKGDVALYQTAQGDLILHRVLDKVQQEGKWKYRFKGDANHYADFKWIEEYRIQGKLMYSIPYVGKLLYTMKEYGVEEISFILFLFILLNRERKGDVPYVSV